MIDVFVLFDVHFVILNKDDCAFIAVSATVVRRTEHCYNRRKCLTATPSVHLIPIHLHLVSSYNREEVVLLEEIFDRFEPKFNRALPLLILSEHDLHSLVIINWISPEQVTQQSRQGWLLESVDVVNLVRVVETG